MFVILYKNVFVKYYVPSVSIKDFHALVGNKPFFDQSVKNKQEAYWEIYLNVKKWWLYNWKFIKLFVLSEILKTYWHWFIKKKKYEYFSTN